MATLSELNVTPLLDLAFVLLIIFMITAPLLSESADLIIPTSNASREAVNPEQVHLISVDQNRQVSLEDEDITATALRDRLMALYKADPQMAIVIRADRRLAVEDLVGVMDIVKNAGITKVGVVTKPGEGG